MKAREQLDSVYKHCRSRIGVFQIRNIINDKIFISSSINMDAAWNKMKTELKFGTYRNNSLQEEWQTYGNENFEFEILYQINQYYGDEIDYNQEVRKLVDIFIEELQPFGNNGYHSLEGIRR